MTTKTASIYRYRVTDVWGTMVGRLEPGTVLQDKEWKGRFGEWTVADLKSGTPVGGWKATYLGKAA